MSERRCDKCDFWKPTKDSHGNCRRNPPALGAIRWPVANAGDWCGEFRDSESAIRQASSLPLSMDYLSVRSFKALHNAGVDTLGAVAVLTADDLRNIRGLGETSVGEVRDVLRERGMTLRGEAAKNPA